MDYQILVNKDNILNKDYVPEDLVEIYEPAGKKMDPNYINKLDKFVYQEFKEMQKDALLCNYEIFVDSSYRSFDYQQKVFDEIEAKKGLEYALRYCALPGSSEHQTGFAFDVIVRRDGVLIEETNENDPELIWLRDNSYKYGFILRYPKGKEEITGYNFEPWHFRYVGRDTALKMHDSGITTLEEYTITKKDVKKIKI